MTNIYSTRFTRAFLSLGLVVFGVSAFMLPAQAATTVVTPTPTLSSTFEVSGWLPYWRAATSTADVLPHLNKLTEINPFGFTVKTDGTLYDAAHLLAYPLVPTNADVIPSVTGLATSTPWYPLITAAKVQKVRVIPTNKTLRTQNVNAIVAMVKQGGFDGVDIDYEGKKASDKDAFSAFLKQLYTAMGNKWVMCTIEARTPPADLNTTTPVNQFQYANDLPQINKYCDRVRVMTYDQESADKTLNAAAGNSIYSPVADPKWITKVIQLMKKDISPKKIEMGVATYGYESDVTPYANGNGYIYDLLWSFNPGYVAQIQSQFKTSAIGRSSAGEPYLTYTNTSAPTTLPANTSPATPTTPNNLSAAAGTAVAQAATTNYALPGTMRYMTWSDSTAIAQKVALAKQLGIRGIAIFKLDGGEDPNMWNVIP
jgi:spore germination protein YaaH